MFVSPKKKTLVMKRLRQKANKIKHSKRIVILNHASNQKKESNVVGNY